MASKRLLRELETYTRDPSAASSAVAELYPVRDDDIFELRAVLRGPEGTGYQGGLFDLAISIPPNYPSSPPSMKFLTPCIHPNISFTTGEICLDLLKTAWTPAYGVVSALEAVAQLLASGGEAESPLNLDVGRLVREGDLVGVEGLVRWGTRRWAMGER